jgi:hypothetical protein
MTSSLPVMKDDSSEARNRAPQVTSAGTPILSRGVLLLAIHVLNPVPLLCGQPIKGDRSAVGGMLTPNPRMVHQDM